MDLALEPLTVHRHAEDLRQSWQGRILARAKDKLGAVVLSVLAHSYDDAMPLLLRVVFPGFTSIVAPFLGSAGKVAKGGQIVADMVTKDGQIIRNAVLFSSQRELESEFRSLADREKLTDAERVELFGAVQRWVVCDFRLDPTMDPRDPDAKRTIN